MPNGGSDCCGTCWFNSKNEGEPGYHGSKKEGIATCQIRGFVIENPFYTYCTNHPHHNPDRIETPLGPVYIDEERKILHKAPDDELTRKELIKLLKNIKETPNNEYPAGIPIDEQVIEQVGILKDKRASTELRRILQFDPNAVPMKANPFQRYRFITLGLAIEALAKIEENNSLNDIEKLVTIGLDDFSLEKYNPKEDKHAVIRYHAIRGLKYTTGDKTINLLKLGMQDYHQEIRAFAKDILVHHIGKEQADKIEKEINQKLGDQNSTWRKFWNKNK